METNPRAHQAVWAPPPPVAVPPLTPAPRPLPPRASKEEFEDLLGNLVEHYATLPPPIFGEPAMLEETTSAAAAPRRIGAWIWVAASVVLMGGVAAALLLTGVVDLKLLGIGSETTVAAPVVAPVAAPAVAEVKIRVSEPVVEPLDEAAVANAEPTKAEPTNAEPTNAEPATAEPVKVAPPAVVAHTTTTHRSHIKRHRASHRVASRARVAHKTKASGKDDWEDPYK